MMRLRGARWLVSFTYLSLAAYACGGSSGAGGPGGDGVGGDGKSVGQAGDGSVDPNAGGGGSGSSSTDPGPRPCDSDKDCTASGKLCDKQRLVCVDCVAPADCGADMACERGQCIALVPCVNSLVCTPLVCSKTTGYCVDCETAADCDDTELCVASTCVKRCDSDKACTPLGLLCDTSAGHCVECKTAADCTAAQYCDGGACVADACTAGSTFCSGNAVIECVSDGSGFSAPGECTGSTCSEGPDGASCDGDELGSGGAAGSGNAAGGSGGSGGSGGGGVVPPAPFLCTDPWAIDNMEEGLLSFCNNDHYIGDWTFAGLGFTTRTLLPEPRGSSLRAIHHTVSAGATISRFNATFGGAHDASVFEGFGFWALVPDAIEIGIGLHTAQTVADQFHGFLLDPVNEAKGLPLASGWHYYVVSFADLKPTGATSVVDKAKLREIQFIVTGTGDIWIDDLSFYPAP